MPALIKRIGLLKALIGAISSLIVAIGILIVGPIKIYRDIINVLHKEVIPEPPHDSVEIAPAVDAKAFEVLPYYLNYTMRVENRDYLYWFRFHVNNPRQTPLYLYVSFVVGCGKATVGSQPIPYTINPKSSDTIYPEPNFDFLVSNVDDVLCVNWFMRDEKDNIVKQGNQRIKVLSKYKFIWDLKTPDGDQVSQDFLIASLTAWTVNSDAAIKKLSKGLDGGSSSVDRWFENCYNYVSSKIEVSSDLDPFPMKGEQFIRTPRRVLEKKSANNALEAALFLGALSMQSARLQGVQIVLFVIPNAEGRKEIILSWSVTSEKWQGFSLNDIKKMNFEKNTDKTGALLRKLRNEHPEMFNALLTTGVFLNKTHPMAALDLARARSRFSIEGLP